MSIRQLMLIAGAAAVLVTPVQARSPQIEVTNSVSVEVEVVAADGSRSTVLQPASTVTPGDQVIYAITYRNSGARPVTDVVINNPLAATLEYIAPLSGQEPLVSADGADFKFLADLSVQGEDGSVRPAIAADVRHLRWIVREAVAAGGQDQVSFRARLK